MDNNQLLAGLFGNRNIPKYKATTLEEFAKALQMLNRQLSDKDKMVLIRKCPNPDCRKETNMWEINCEHCGISLGQNDYAVLREVLLNISNYSAKTMIDDRYSPLLSITQQFIALVMRIHICEIENDIPIRYVSPAFIADTVVANTRFLVMELIKNRIEWEGPENIEDLFS